LKHADIFVGAGGTMSREAALLGVRAYTMFDGRLPALDQRLIDDGALIDLRGRDAASIDWSARIATDRADADQRLRRRGPELRQWLATVIEEAACEHRGSRSSSRSVALG
jgi:predicted glycosyltransferase